MPEKVEVAVFDEDLKIRKLKKFDVSENGAQIRIVSGGEGHFMPRFDSSSFLEFPSWKKYLLFGPRSWKRLYFVRNKGEKCVNFKTETTYGPNPEQLKRANLQLLAEKIGADSNKGIPWYSWLTLLFSLVSFILLLKVAGVIV